MCPNPIRVLERGHGYVAIKMGRIIIYSCYFSPNSRLTEFEAFLDTLGDSVRKHIPGTVIVAGDFNAKSICWGAPRTSPRGRVLEA